jgi:hypothetical protein
MWLIGKPAPRVPIVAPIIITRGDIEAHVYADRRRSGFSLRSPS